MIVEWMMDLGALLFDVIFSLLGVLPKFSSDVINVVNSVFDIMFNGVSLVSIFVDMQMVKTLIPFVIGILNFDNIAKLVMFILKKIPILGIK